MFRVCLGASWFRGLRVFVFMIMSLCTLLQYTEQSTQGRKEELFGVSLAQLGTP